MANGQCEQWQRKESCLEKLQLLYVSLEEPDLVKGVAALRDQWCLDHRALARDSCNRDEESPGQESSLRL